MIVLGLMSLREKVKAASLAAANAAAPVATEADKARAQRAESIALSMNSASIAKDPVSSSAVRTSGEPNLQTVPGSTAQAANTTNDAKGVPLKMVCDGPEVMPASVAQLPGVQAVLALSIPARNAASIEKGRKIFVSACMACHGREACGLTPANFRAVVKVRDLRYPYNYKYGSGEKAIFRSISEGTSSIAMPRYNGRQGLDEIWCLVFYLQSLTKRP
jgi:mono/diheme cytochrome c family protein